MNYELDTQAAEKESKKKHHQKRFIIYYVNFNKPTKFHAPRDHIKIFVTPFLLSILGTEFFLRKCYLSLIIQ